MTIEEHIIEEYEKRLMDLYAKANTKSKKKRIIYDLFNFSSLCYNFFGIEKIFDWESDDNLIKLLEDFTVPFVENTYKDRERYLKISTSVLNTFIEVNYPFYEDYYKRLYKLSPSVLQELIYEFLNSYDPIILKKYKEKINENEIFQTSLYKTTGYAGMHFPMNGLKKSLIFCENDFDNIFRASTIVHELGHTYEYSLAYDAGINGYDIEKDILPYTEVSSKFFEYAFLNYLKENNLYSNDTRICLLKYYKSMLLHIYDMNLICNMNRLYINKYGYAVMNDAEISEYASKLKAKLNYYNLVSEKEEEINYKHSFIYGLGSLFSIYLYDYYKKNPTYFKKKFKNMLISYPNKEDILDVFGITDNTLCEGLVLKKTLEDIKVMKHG